MVESKSQLIRGFYSKTDDMEKVGEGEKKDLLLEGSINIIEFDFTRYSSILTWRTSPVKGLIGRKGL